MSDRLMKILIAPVISEKSTMVADKNRTIVFHVLPDATKREIKLAVHKIFNVDVVDIGTSITKGKSTRFRGSHGRRKNWKKAYIRLAEGQDINFSDFS